MRYHSCKVTDTGLSLGVESKFLEFIIKLFMKKAKRKVFKLGFIPKGTKVETVCDINISFNVKDLPKPLIIKETVGKTLQIGKYKYINENEVRYALFENYKTASKLVLCGV